VSQQTANRTFDELTRGLASGSISRGRALRLMGAALVGGTLSSLGLGGVAAADPPGCKRNGKTCRLDRTCCSGNCAGRTCACQSNGGSCSTGSQCCSGNCSSGTCCPSGTVRVNGACATPCTGFGTCPASCPGCIFGAGGGGAAYCRGSGALSMCTSHADCPSGQFCGVGDPTRTEGFCFTVC
jgi:hypothetical protein